MEKEHISTGYHQLKALYAEVMDFVREESGWDGALSAATLIEEDLGMVGLDNEIMLMNFSERFGVDFEEFDYEAYLTPESELFGCLFVLTPVLVPIWLVAQAVRMIGALSLRMISKEKSASLWRWEGWNLGLPRRKDLSLGDLVVSALGGRFTERAEVLVVLG